MNNRIDSLQWLRAIAAYWVLFTHVLQRLHIQPFGYSLSGQWGVDIFFILSGFIIFFTTKDGSDWLFFLKKRILRIYPLYLICLSAYYLFSHFSDGLDLSLMGWLQNIMMMPFMDSIGYHSLVVGQAWSTCYELYFYAVLCILLMFKIRKIVILPVLVFLMFIGMLFSHVGAVTSFGFGRYLVSLIGARHIIMFCIGIFLALCYKNNAYICRKARIVGEKIVNFSCEPAVFVIVTILYLICIFSRYNFLLSLIVSSTVFALYLLGGSICERSGRLNKVLVYLGDISFSVYLVHALIIRGLFALGCDKFTFLLCATLVVTTIISSITYHYIERPFMKLAKRT